MKIVCTLLIAAGLLLASRAALAQERASNLIAEYGFGFSVGAGVTGFIDADMRDATKPGGTWEARVAAGTRKAVTIEAAYVGSAQEIDALGLDPDAILLGSGVEAGARLNVFRGPMRPFFMVGGGWTHYDVTNAEVNTSSVNNDDDVLVLPLGIGIDYRVGAFVTDLRAVMRPTFFNDLLPDSPEEGNPTRLDNWSLLLRGGFEF